MSEELDLEEERREQRRRRSSQPRLGSFVTIAVAILLLFGAASRMGKSPETAALFNIDRNASTQLQREQTRIRNEEERLRTFLTIGAVPVQQQEAPQPAAMIIDRDPEPPYRGEFDIEEQRRINRLQVAMIVPDTRTVEPPSSPGMQPAPSANPAHNPVPEAAPQSRPQDEAAAATYVVANGDTWVKIAKNTLGDAKRWQDIQSANPSAKDGLRVGMRLAIPR